MCVRECVCVLSEVCVSVAECDLHAILATTQPQSIIRHISPPRPCRVECVCARSAFVDAANRDFLCMVWCVTSFRVVRLLRSALNGLARLFVGLSEIEQWSQVQPTKSSGAGAASNGRCTIGSTAAVKEYRDVAYRLLNQYTWQSSKFVQ